MLAPVRARRSTAASWPPSTRLQGCSPRLPCGYPPWTQVAAWGLLLQRRLLLQLGLPLPKGWPGGCSAWLLSQQWGRRHLLLPGRRMLLQLPANQLASPQESSWQMLLLLLLLPQLQEPSSLCLLLLLPQLALLLHLLHHRGPLRAPLQAARGSSRQARHPL